MSDHDTWNMFAAASYAAWMAGGDYAAEECRNRAVADADWFVIESNKRIEERSRQIGSAIDAPEPTPPQPDDDGWIKWEGGSCPVPPDTLIDVRTRGTAGPYRFRAYQIGWRQTGSRTDLVAYRIVS
ncbi:MAG: hypothetical protein ABFD94_13990, partial [Armatimonadia bacterium]